MNPAPPVTITGTRLIAASFIVNGGSGTLALIRLRIWTAILRLEGFRYDTNIKYLRGLIEANNH